MRIAGFCGHCVVVGEAMAQVDLRFFLMEGLGRLGDMRASITRHRDFSRRLVPLLVIPTAVASRRGELLVFEISLRVYADGAFERFR